jgi:hypothetical protein
VQHLFAVGAACLEAAPGTPEEKQDTAAATAKTKPTPRRMRRRNPQAIRAPARGSRTVITTTTPDDITAGTAAGNLRN